MNQETVMNKQNTKMIKIIKRYQNRKLYDTQQSCYVTLEDIAKMIRANEEIMVIDNKTKNDITAATLTQIIFEAEKKASQYAPLFTLRDIIQNGNGSISSYLAKLGAFSKDYAEKVPVIPSAPHEAQGTMAEKAKPSSFDDMKQTLEERVVNAANSAKNNKISSIDNNGFNVAEETPSLPHSNKSLDSPTTVD